MIDAHRYAVDANAWEEQMHVRRALTSRDLSGSRGYLDDLQGCPEYYWLSLFNI